MLYFQIGKGKVAEIKLEELGSNKLFASCPIETYPGPAVQQVVDSSRYEEDSTFADSNF